MKQEKFTVFVETGLGKKLIDRLIARYEVANKETAIHLANQYIKQNDVSLAWVTDPKQEVIFSIFKG